MKRIIFVLIFIIGVSCSDNGDNKKIIFIGDSLVWNWDTDYYFPQKLTYNRGIGGATIEDVSKLNFNADNSTFVLLVGTNNLPRDREFSSEFKCNFINSYMILINKINAEKIIIISLLPREPNYMTDAIRILNMDLKESFKDMSNIVFLDVFDSFLYKNSINQEYYSDGLHLSYYGYRELSDQLNVLL